VISCVLAVLLRPFFSPSFSSVFMKEGFVRALSSHFFPLFCVRFGELTRATPCYITRKRFAIELAWFGSASICFGLGHFLFVLCGVPSFAFSSVPFLFCGVRYKKGRSAATSLAFPHLLFVSHLGYSSSCEHVFIL